MLYSAAVPILFFLYSGTHAQTASTVQGDWVVPSSPDKSYSVMNGESMTIAWTSHLQAWFPIYCSECDDTNVDLWVMGGNIYIKITEGIDVTSTLSYTWTVDIGTAQLASQPLWVFRFIPAKTEWSGGSGQNIASPLFDISPAVTTTQKAAASTSTTTSISFTTTPSQAPDTSQASSTLVTSTPFAIPTSPSPSTSTSISTSTSQSSISLQSSSTLVSSTSSRTNSTGNAASSSTSNPVSAASNSKKLSTGAKAGIGIGAAIGAIILFLLGWILAKRTKSSATSDPASDAFTNKEITTSHANTITPNAQELGVTSNSGATPRHSPTSELEGTSARIMNPVELEGYNRY